MAALEIRKVSTIYYRSFGDYFYKFDLPEVKINSHLSDNSDFEKSPHNHETTRESIF